MKKLYLLGMLCMLILFPANAEEEKHDAGKDGVRNVLFIGDSMTGWLSERLNAYGRLNGFDVSTIV